MTVAAPLLRVRGLGKTYPRPAGLLAQLTGRTPPPVQVVQGVSFDIQPGEVLGLVGESGSGKSTTAMTVIRLQTASAGSIEFRGTDVTRYKGAQIKAFRRQAQIVFQDPYQSINPRFTVLQTVTEPLVVHGLAQGPELRRRAVSALAQVGLPNAEAMLDRFPARLSGGQRQRVSIARAMILDPQLLIADEPVSMLDVSIRAGVLRLIKKLAQERQLGVLYISHDIATVRYLCDRVAVMYLGRIVEEGPTEDVLASPLHPYTQALIKAVPRAGGARRSRVVLGSSRGRHEAAGGCAFSARCPRAVERCLSEAPALSPAAPDRQSACHLTAASERAASLTPGTSGGTSG